MLQKQKKALGAEEEERQSLVGRGRKEKAQACSQEESAGRKILDNHKWNH